MTASDRLVDTERGIVSREVFVSDGIFAEGRENPHDGTWLVCRRLPAQDGAEDELIIIDDIAEVRAR